MAYDETFERLAAERFELVPTSPGARRLHLN